jgi:hypothetical protein
MIMEAITKAGYKAGEEIVLALDVAASEMVKDGSYVMYKSTNEKRTAAQMVDWYTKLVSQYPIVSIEDGMGENDWEGWKALTDAIGDQCQLVGDDLFVTNVNFLAKGIAEGVASLQGLATGAQDAAANFVNVPELGALVVAMATGTITAQTRNVALPPNIAQFVRLLCITENAGGNPNDATATLKILF